MGKNIHIYSQEFGPSKLARFFGGPDGGHGGFDPIAEEYGNDVILERELRTQYSKNLSGTQLESTVAKERYRLSSLRISAYREMMTPEINRVPVNTIEYEWRSDESGELRLWYAETEDFAYKLYEHTKEYADKYNKKGLYNQTEYDAFLQIETSLRERQATSAILGVHHESQMTRYVQQLSIEGEKVKISYIDVGLFRRDLYADEGKSLVSSFASEKEGRTLHGNDEGEFVFVLFKSGSITPRVIQELAIAKVLVNDSLQENKLNEFVNSLRHPTIYVDEHIRNIQQEIVGISSKQENIFPLSIPNTEVTIPTSLVGMWLSTKTKQVTDSIHESLSFVDGVMQMLRPNEAQLHLSSDTRVEIVNSVVENTHLVEQEVMTVQTIEEILSLITEQGASKFKSKDIEETKDHSEGIARVIEIVFDNAVLIEERLEKTQESMAIVALAVQEPLFIVAALGALNQIGEPLVLPSLVDKEVTNRELVDKSSKNHGKEDQLLSILVRLAILINRNTEGQQIKKIALNNPHETPFPKSIKISVELSKGISGDISLQFSFTFGLLMLLSNTSKAPPLQKEADSKTIQHNEENNQIQEEYIPLLLSIILYMDQIREQGIVVMPPQKKKQQTKKKKKFFPRSAVLYMYTSEVCYY